MSRLKTEIEAIATKLEQTDKLQKELDSLIKQKETKDKDHKSEEKKLQKSLESLAQKNEALRLVNIRADELRTEKGRLQKEISTTLRDYADLSKTDPAEIALKLRKDADDYSECVSKLSKEEPAYRSIIKTIEVISAIKATLSELLSTVEPIETQINLGRIGDMTNDIIEGIWQDFRIEVSTIYGRIKDNENKTEELNLKLNKYYQATGKTETTLRDLLKASEEINNLRRVQEKHREESQKNATLLAEAIKYREDNLKLLQLEDESQVEDIEKLRSDLDSAVRQNSDLTVRIGAIKEKLETDEKNRVQIEKQIADIDLKRERMEKWEKMNRYFGGTRFRTLVQSHILRPLLKNANIYLHQITDHYTLTCSDENEQLSILVLDRYHNNEPRSVTVLSGGERFMVSLALSLALSSMNRPDMNVDILFIDEGFGTLDSKSL
ncbi:MAG: hypothetical protein K2H72_05900, partial [Muribaculaceae bacterium]|nr:hypothetical protein [Muribaculaceae bacterium]